MLVFGDGVLRPHHLGRGCREVKSGLASIMKITLFSPPDQEFVNTMQVVEMVLENPQNNPVFIHRTGMTCENCNQIVHVQLGYSSVCVFARARP